MFKVYDKLEDVPEGQREHYKLIGGKWVPEVSEDHPVLVNNRTLLNEKTAAETKASGLETKVTGLTADLDSAKATSLPRGHRAVPVAEVEALNAIKEHGTPEEITAKLAEHKTLKEESDKRSREDHLRKVAKILDYSNADAFVQLANLPEFEIRQDKGKDIVVAKVKDGTNVVEKPQADIDSLPAVAPFIAALKTKGGVYAPEQRRDDGKPAGNQYDKIREDAKKRAEREITAIPLSHRKGLRVIGEKAA